LAIVIISAVSRVAAAPEPDDAISSLRVSSHESWRGSGGVATVTK
jgi:hypothetical protein